ncbi:MAG: DUF1294 domain-containing protein [Anaerocolumna sp.]
MRIIFIAVIIYLIVINIVGYAVMGIDKYRAGTNRWRVKEKTLFFLAIIGGSAGSILGMQYFRHKTKHNRFIFGMPLILLLQIMLIIYLFNR